MLEKNNRYTRGMGLKFLAYNSNQTISLNVVVDINRTVLRRSELKSRSSLMDEQSNPWKLLHFQDEKIQHRGSKHRSRYGL